MPSVYLWHSVRPWRIQAKAYWSDQLRAVEATAKATDMLRRAHGDIVGVIAEIEDQQRREQANRQLGYEARLAKGKNANTN